MIDVVSLSPFLASSPVKWSSVDLSFLSITLWFGSLVSIVQTMRGNRKQPKTKVLAAEGHKGVPLDPDLADLLQGLLKLDARHRLSARDALASPYFAPRPGVQDERVSDDG